MLKLDDQTLLHLRVKGIANDFYLCSGRNVLWCAGDGGRGVCSSDVHRLMQKPVSATEMQFTHATRSPRASQIAGRVVCGSKVDIAEGVRAVLMGTKSCTKILNFSTRFSLPSKIS